MTWGSTGGGGVGTEVGSPEAEAGARALRDGPGRPDQEPERRPGCLRTVLLLIAALAIVVAIVWLIGIVLGGT